MAESNDKLQAAVEKAKKIIKGTSETAKKIEDKLTH